MRVAYRNASRLQARELFVRMYTKLSVRELEEWRKKQKWMDEAEGVGAGHSALAPLGLGKTAESSVDIGSEDGSSTVSSPVLAHSRCASTTSLDSLASASISSTATSLDAPKDLVFERRVLILASEFAVLIPEETFSMASLQGFLLRRAMMRPDEPEIAVRDVGRWVASRGTADVEDEEEGERRTKDI